MAGENIVGEFMKGDYGFLTIMLLFIGLVWFIINARKKAKIKKMRKEGKQIPLEWLSKKERAQLKNPVQPPVIQQQVAPQQIPEAPKEQVPVIAPQQIPEDIPDEMFDLEFDEEGKSLRNVEHDAVTILKKKTENIEIGLIKEKEVIEEKLQELQNTEEGIKEIVEQLKVKFRQVQRQKKTYQLMKRSLQMAHGEGGLIR